MTDWVDTHPDIRSLQIDLMREAPAWRKTELLFQMNRTVVTLLESGLRLRYPEDSPQVIKRRLADLLLGTVLAEQVYGPFIEGE